uniref:HERV-H LTR-associating 2b, tandem duplicate 2 n=1 Tax=Sinocyclocheilus anshuiensis TaxID=1608454 RepID=A0A671QRT1_9TELE
MKLFFLLWILPVILGDTHVTRIYSEECMLPCTSTNLDIIHWYLDKKAVHSFYHNQDQLGHQHEDYKGRTSLLSESEIKNGNLSLLIRNIRVQDEGRYRCYTADEKTNDEKYVVVSVEAPAKSVNITLKGDTVICSTSGVYPEPKVLWSSDPPAKESLNNVSQAEDNLFTVTSQLKVDAITDTYTYNCSITTKDTYSYTASLKQQAASELSKNEFIFKCPVTKDFNYTLILSLSTTIMRYYCKTSMKNISEQWRDKVTFHPENGSIILSHLNQEQLGTYTCESATAQYRYITQTKVQSRGLGMKVYIIICVSIGLAIFLIAPIVYVVKKRKKRRPSNARNSRETSDSGQEMEKLNGSKDN